MWEGVGFRRYEGAERGGAGGFAIALTVMLIALLRSTSALTVVAICMEGTNDGFRLVGNDGEVFKSDYGNSYR